MTLIAALTTVATREQARTLARSLVEQRLAACVQIEAIESVYRWDGALQQDGEFRLLIKTEAGRWDALREAVLREHPYELPALAAWPLPLASDAFAQWVAEESRL